MIVVSILRIWSFDAIVQREDAHHFSLKAPLSQFRFENHSKILKIVFQFYQKTTASIFVIRFTRQMMMKSLIAVLWNVLIANLQIGNA